MAATARTPAKRKPPARRPALPPALPPGDAPVIIGIPVRAEGEELPEPERVPVFQIGETVYTMLAEPPPTMGIAAIDAAARMGGPGFGEMYVLREMMGSAALNALIDAGKKRWLTKAQYEAITTRVRNAAFGLEEDDDPNR